MYVQQQTKFDALHRNNVFLDLFTRKVYDNFIHLGSLLD